MPSFPGAIRTTDRETGRRVGCTFLADELTPRRLAPFLFGFCSEPISAIDGHHRLRNRYFYKIYRIRRLWSNISDSARSSLKLSDCILSIDKLDLSSNFHKNGRLQLVDHLAEINASMPNHSAIERTKRAPSNTQRSPVWKFEIIDENSDLEESLWAELGRNLEPRARAAGNALGEAYTSIARVALGWKEDLEDQRAERKARLRIVPRSAKNRPASISKSRG